ncbi:ROK family protein [Paenibacillus sp. UNC451MF]|uniref:ROK family protein n=1 Tax=Paenibacillus sp. UNC451MF TaxID=1449063 RepID=UPI000490156E|nr:ROK family protein [Paenibacillus sp. UNC451MF]
MSILAGIDIGGTKCAVSLGKPDDKGTGIKLIHKDIIATPREPEKAIEQLITIVEGMLNRFDLASPGAIGISCGGPLDCKAGVIVSPPNLPHWHGLNVTRPFHDHFHTDVGLQNDANACALAEWQWGAGKGSRNMIFLTFGTGMGAGLILDGKLYSGTNDMAGEVGHMRMTSTGPYGYGKWGSFEGYCSGGGIARLAQSMVLNHLHAGRSPSFCANIEQLKDITAEAVGVSAQAGDPLALEIMGIVGERLGESISWMIDMLNPERIIVGSIYGRQRSILEPIVLDKIQKDAHPYSASVCTVVPAGLGERIGDYASLSVALHQMKQQE